MLLRRFLLLAVAWTGVTCADSRVRPHSDAVEALNAILRGPKRAAAAAPKPEAAERAADPAGPRFTSDVRLVNLAVAVYTRDGEPVTDLQPADFEVREDGVRQEVSLVASEEAPFNLVLLLDLSGSTLPVRDAMKEAARKFIAIARPRDRIALYAIADNRFHVVSPLTGQREPLLSTIDAIPDVSGGTPLYDAIVLSYAEELHQRREERNAIIVISDGLDGQLHGVEGASSVRFRRLERAAAEMNTLIYSVLFNPFTLVPPSDHFVRGRRNLESLARLSGGRVFTAPSIYALDPVYPQVSRELRSVYTVAYYPRNQSFDGQWRKLQVRVKRPGARVRTRAGYRAW